MHIVLFDALLERHVCESLVRALRARGHRVTWTGPLWQGFRYPKEPADLARLAAAVDRVIGLRPHALLTFRAAALRPEQARRLRDAGIRTAAWFPDDPVLYKVSTSRAVAMYDVLLHAGGPNVLDLYEREHGRSGVTFPFWTDEVAFPYAYDPDRADLDVVFLGNTHTRVKRWRYDWIAASAVPVTIYGRVAEDPAGLCAGVLGSDEEVARTLSRARFGLNISQQFTDYTGTMYDFPGLADMGEFPVPSRVVQFAAVGLPVLTVSSQPQDRLWWGMFPEAIPVADHGQLEAVVGELSADRGRLRELSRATHERFRRSYTAEARARLLEDLLTEPGWPARLPAAQRFRLFLDYESRPRWRRDLHRLMFPVRARQARARGAVRRRAARLRPRRR